MNRYTGILILLLACLSGCAATPVVDALQWHTGTSRTQIEQELRQSGASVRAAGPDRLVVYATLLPSVYAPQRGLLSFSAGDELQRLNLVVEPLPDSTPVEVLRLYADVRALCVRHAGSPDLEYTEGEDTDPNLLRELSAGHFTRLVQWDNGGSLRMGIPRRTDGEILIEIERSERRLPREDVFRGAAPF